MKKILLTTILMFIVVSGFGQDMEFGKITITPFISRESKLDATATLLSISSGYETMPSMKFLA